MSDTDVAADISDVGLRDGTPELYADNKKYIVPIVTTKLIVSFEIEQKTHWPQWIRFGYLGFKYTLMTSTDLRSVLHL